VVVVELSGALWNLYIQGRPPRLVALHQRLLPGYRQPVWSGVRYGDDREPFSLRSPRFSQRAGRPLRVREVHAAVEELFGERVPFSSVNEALSTHANGEGGLFQRVRYGTYGNCGTLSVRHRINGPQQGSHGS